ncbi:MAG: thioredoxin family protein [Saprospiraceae bacterium]|nr:thioredoxin family protein [Saprospiraceae bacterium]
MHNLYQNHLDQGKTVVIKFFFTSCPPCRSNAPFINKKWPGATISMIQDLWSYLLCQRMTIQK